MFPIPLIHKTPAVYKPEDESIYKIFRFASDQVNQTNDLSKGLFCKNNNYFHIPNLGMLFTK